MRKESGNQVRKKVRIKRLGNMKAQNKGKTDRLLKIVGKK